MSSRVVAWVVSGLLLAAGGATVDALAVAQAGPVLSPITATFDEDRRATVYTVELKSEAGRPLAADSYSWTLQPPADDPTCDELLVSATTPSEATWFHADTDGCTHKGVDHAGVVSVTVKHDGYTCTATYQGSKTGTGPRPAACVSTARACTAERAAVAKWESIIAQLEGQIADAKVARNGAELTISQASRELDAIVEQGAGFWDTIAGGGAYQNRYDAAAAALSKAKKALRDIESGLADLKRELSQAFRALSKANEALQACSRRTYALQATAACEAQERSLVAAKAALATATKVRTRLGPPAARARRAIHAAVVLLSKPAPSLPTALRADVVRAAGKARAAERQVSKIVTGLVSEVRATKRRAAAAAAKLEACRDG